MEGRQGLLVLPLYAVDDGIKPVVDDKIADGCNCPVRVWNGVCGARANKHV